MSTFSKVTRHPQTGKWEMARWIDDYYAHHVYGVHFNSDDKTYPTEQVDKAQITDFWVQDVVMACFAFFNDEPEEKHQKVADFLNEIQREYNERWKRDPATGEGATDKSVVVRKNKTD